MDKQPSSLPMIIVTALIAAVIFGGLGYYLAKRQTANDTTARSAEVSSPTPEISVIASPSQASTSSASATKTISADSDFSGKTQTYTVSYPADWSAKKIDTDPRIIAISYKLADNEYGINFQMGSNHGTGDKVTDSTVTYAGKSFTRRVFSDSKTNTITNIAYMPNDSSAPFETVLASVPAQDSEKYIAEYDKIMTSLKISQ